MASMKQGNPSNQGHPEMNINSTSSVPSVAYVYEIRTSLKTGHVLLSLGYAGRDSYVTWFILYSTVLVH